MSTFLENFREQHHSIYLLVKLLGPVFILILVLLLIVGLLVFHSIVHPKESTEVISPSEYRMHALDFTWNGADGDQLQGWYIRGSNQAPLIILCHGYESNRTDVLSLAARLKNSGYNLFLFNQRGHGVSDYNLFSLGLRESIDLKEAMDKLILKPEIDVNRIGIYGETSGAYLALQAGVGNPKVRVLVLDSAYKNINDFIHLQVKKILGFKTSIISSLVSLLYDIYFGVSPGMTSEEFQPRDFADKSILFISSSDRKSSDLAKDTRRLYTYFQCRQKDILQLPLSKSQLFGPDKFKYDKHVLNFFKMELPINTKPDASVQDSNQK